MMLHVRSVCSIILCLQDEDSVVQRLATLSFNDQSPEQSTVGDADAIAMDLHASGNSAVDNKEEMVCSFKFHIHP